MKMNLWLPLEFDKSGEFNREGAEGRGLLEQGIDRGGGGKKRFRGISKGIVYI